MNNLQNIEPSDGRAARFPVSVKGVVVVDGKFVLLKNEREEWELPGGKLESNEEPQSCLVREIEEELGLSVSIDRTPGCTTSLCKVEVLIVTLPAALTNGRPSLSAMNIRRWACFRKTIPKPCFRPIVHSIPP